MWNLKSQKLLYVVVFKIKSDISLWHNFFFYINMIPDHKENTFTSITSLLLQEGLCAMHLNVDRLSRLKLGYDYGILFQKIVFSFIHQNILLYIQIFSTF